MKKFLFIIICFVAGIAIINGCDNDIVQVNPYDPESENTIIGGINGAVSPASSNALISAKRGTIIYASTRIDPDGHFSLQNLPQGQYSLIVEANNFFTDSSNTNIQVTARTETSLGTIYLNSSTHGSISGIVEPYSENTLVKLNKNNILIDSARVDEISKFTFTMLDPGIYGLEINLSGYSDYSIDNIRVNAGTTTVLDTIVMSSIYGSIIGVVEPYDENTLVKLNQDDNLLDSTRVDEASEFNFTMLDGGTYGIEITLTGYSTYSNDAVIVSSGAITNLGTIILNDISKGSITGIISPKSSQAVVGLMQDNNSIDATVIDPITGQYIFTNLEPGIYDIYITAEGYADAVIMGITVIAGETNENNNYILEETGTIIGTVYPVNSNALVTAIKNEEVVTEARINPVDGSYTLPNLIPGFYNLVISSDGWITDESVNMERLNVGTTVSIARIYLAQNGSNVIYGRITDLNSGTIVTGALVELAGIRFEADIEGYYSFADISSGSKNITIQKSGYLPVMGLINIPSIGSSSNNFSLEPAGMLSGVVRDVETMNGIGSARIEIDDGDFVTYSDVIGNYTFDYLPGGDHSVQISKEGYNTKVELITIFTGVNSFLDIALARPTFEGGSINGRVQDYYTNSSISGAMVTIAGTVGYTNPTGFYQIDMIPIGDYEVEIDHDEYLPQFEQVTIIENENARIDFNLIPDDSLNSGPTGTVSGLLKDNISGETIDFTGNYFIYLRFQGSSYEPSFYCSEIENGRFQIINHEGYGHPNYNTPNLPIGNYHLTGSNTNVMGTFGYKEFDIELNVREGNNTIELRMSPLCGIGGRIFDAVTEEPVQDAMIFYVYTNENGLFYKNNIDPDISSCSISKTGYYYESHRISLMAGQNNMFNFGITPYPRLRGIIRNSESNQVLSGVEVISTYGGTATSDEAGVYEMLFSFAYQNTINFAKPGFQSYSIQVNIPRTGVTTLDVRLSPN